MSTHLWDIPTGVGCIRSTTWAPRPTWHRPWRPPRRWTWTSSCRGSNPRIVTSVYCWYSSSLASLLTHCQTMKEQVFVGADGLARMLMSRLEKKPGKNRDAGDWKILKNCVFLRLWLRRQQTRLESLPATCRNRIKLEWAVQRLAKQQAKVLITNQRFASMTPGYN